MAQAKGEAKILQMIEMIKKEAKEESDQIITEVKYKLGKQKTSIFSAEYEKLQAEFKERDDNDRVQRRLELSRKTNEVRLEVQKHRSVLLAELKNDTETRLKETIKDQKKYRQLVKSLVLQGAVRLLEPEIWVMCRQEDRELVEGLLGEVAAEYREFTKANVGKEMSTTFSVVTEKWMEESDIGGVILYCNKYRTVFNNSLRSRLDLAFENSIPDIRRLLFPGKGKAK